MMVLGSAIVEFVSTNFIQNYSPACDIGIIILSIVLLIALRESFVCSSRAFNIFVSTFLFVILAAGSNVALYAGYHLQFSFAFLLLCRSLYRIIMIIIMELFILYIYRIIGLNRKSVLIASAAVNGFLGVLDILLPIVGFEKYDNPFTIPFFIAYINSIVLCTYLLAKYEYKVIKQLKRALILSETIAFLVIVLESFFRQNTFMTFTFVLPSLSVMFIAHANPYNLDTGALGLSSFESYLKERMSKKTSFYCIKFIATDDFYINKELGIYLRGFWNRHFADAVLFNPVNNFVVFAVNHGIDDVGICESREIVSNIFKIECKTLILPSIEFCTSFNEFYNVFCFFTDGMEANTIKVCKEEDLEKLHRHHVIIGHLQDIYQTYDLNDERVLVYCQPILNALTGVYDTAEALMRLELPGLGMIYPDEFISLLEERDYIHRFSMIILNKVCDYIASMKDYPINRISVNFSVRELKREDFVEDFKKILHRNQVDFNKIGVEFTESTNNADFVVIRNTVNELRELGCTVYLDDFGTGYSNFDRLLGLHMNVIKFDRSLLVLASEDAKAKQILSSFSEVFKKLDCQILYEGVETEEQENLCRDGKASYLQGYFYSRPVPIDRISAFLSKTSTMA